MECAAELMREVLSILGEQSAYLQYAMDVAQTLCCHADHRNRPSHLASNYAALLSCSA